MLSIVDILMEIREECDIKSLAEKFNLKMERLEEILRCLSEYNIVEYERQTGKVRTSKWLSEIEVKIEEVNPVVGAMIIPRNQKVRLQEITIENFTDMDLELNVRFGPKLKEIAICKLG
ncbi:hypothetical protein KEJ34_07950 [Candidatus Bathyarchaeota archaeon]|nr:hypothetical protein [Candidatus Bathyarchaeota archaeon]